MQASFVAHLARENCAARAKRARCDVKVIILVSHTVVSQKTLRIFSHFFQIFREMHIHCDVDQNLSRLFFGARLNRAALWSHVRVVDVEATPHPVGI